MKAYKATYNLKCRNQTYVIGETYTSDELQICESGFHFCNNMSDVLNYYPYNNNFVLIEVEILGDTQFKDNKGVTNKMKVLRIVPEDEYDFMTRNEKGNRVVKFKHIGMMSCLREFDNMGNLIYSKNYDYFRNSGLFIHEEWYEYDDNGNETYFMNSNGRERGVSIKN